MKAKEVDRTLFIDMFEDRLKAVLSSFDGILWEGMRYAMLHGGKRVRPTCVYLGAMAVGGDIDIEQVMDLAIGIECVHGYSLVHDDLPAMDNDDYRRGMLSTHKKFGHANGILIGDQLLTTAMQVLLDGAKRYGSQFAQSAKYIAKGAMDMADGQALDLGGCHTKDEFLAMYRKKTGALIYSAFIAGANVANADDAQLKIVEEYASNIGLAFQLADDLLDNDTASILSVISVDEAQSMLDCNTKTACEIAKRLENSDELLQFATMLSTRKS